MASYGMLRRMALVRIDVSEERSARIIRVTKIGEVGTTLAVTSNRRTLRSFSETSVPTRATRPNIPEDAILHYTSQIKHKIKTQIQFLPSPSHKKLIPD
jgi:hypothetical protein